MKDPGGNLPQHIAIIMDGNGRWARERGLSRTAGHRAGADTVRAIVEECGRIGIAHLTLFAFSSENWTRPKGEIGALFALLAEFLALETPRLVSRNVRLDAIGEIEKLPAPSRLALAHARAATQECTGMRLNLALNYGGRNEIVRAAKKLFEEIKSPHEIDEEKFARFLDTAGQPDPDLLIRTSGELRLSNFLLWQCAYSEFYFSPLFWPDFTPQELHRALESYKGRKRRFGAAE